MRTIVATTCKALTICQPYAELIARGEKVVENRTWPTAYRGPLAIHAGKSRAWLDASDEEKYRNMAFVAIVATADLVACLPRLYPADPYNWPDRWRHLADHAHANGPWCFVLENVRRLAAPVPCRGMLGLWDATNLLYEERVTWRST